MVELGQANVSWDLGGAWARQPRGNLIYSFPTSPGSAEFDNKEAPDQISKS